MHPLRVVVVLRSRPKLQYQQEQRARRRVDRMALGRLEDSQRLSLGCTWSPRRRFEQQIAGSNLYDHPLLNLLIAHRFAVAMPTTSVEHAGAVHCTQETMRRRSSRGKRSGPC